MLHTGKLCPICNGGMIGFRRCEDGTTLVLMCDECQAVWRQPENLSEANALFPAQPSFCVPGLECAIAGGSAGWATTDEIDAYGWASFAVAEGAAIDESD